MDPAVAALIGAGVGSSGAIAAQFVGHSLTVKRDRQNQKRERLHLVVTEAAFAVFRSPRDERVSWEEWQQQERHPESHAALNPKLVRDVEPFATRSAEGITLLQIHFGDDHWLVDKYVSTCGVCLKAEQTLSEQFHAPDDQRPAKVPGLVKVLREAQEARTRWVKEARAEVERI